MNNDIFDKQCSDIDTSNFMKENQIFATDKEKLKISSETKFGDCVSYVMNELPSPFPILAEIGAETFSKVISGEEGNNHIDFLLVTKFVGDLDISCIGTAFPNSKQIETAGYTLVNISEKVRSDKGYLVFFVYANDSLLNDVSF